MNSNTLRREIHAYLRHVAGSVHHENVKQRSNTDSYRAMLMLILLNIQSALDSKEQKLPPMNTSISALTMLAAIGTPPRRLSTQQ